MKHKIALIIGGKVSQHFIDSLDDINIQVYGAETIAESIDLAVGLEVNAQAEAVVAPRLTANELKKHIHMPVIPADPTYFDIIETLRYAEIKSGITGDKVALVMHTSRQIEKKRIQPFISNRLYIYFFHEESNIQDIIQELKLQYFHLAIGGTTTYSLAQHAGMHCFLLRLGRETLLTAVDRADAILEFDRIKNEQNERLKIVLNSVPDGVLVTDRDGRVTECNARAAEIFKIPAENIFTHKVGELTNDTLWKDVYQEGAEPSNILMEINNAKLFTTRKPIIVNNEITGAVAVFQEVTQIEKLEHEYRKLKTSGFTAKYQFSDILGHSKIMNKVIEQAKAFARVESTVLIEGETGTGKELFAQSMHNHSLRKNGPFVAVNCAALPETLLESELMGYEEGAFTGAKRGGKPGLFELAHKGTIFLDEISQIPLQLQARILRILQEKQVMRLGGEKVIPVNVRVIAASNETLERLIAEHRFREDLYYRLNVLNLRLPALYERKEDIPQLLQHFLEIFAKIYGTELTFSELAVHMLMEYDWPGNIRELLNFVERYVVINNQLRMTDLHYVKDYLASGNKRNRKDWMDDESIRIKIGSLENMEQQMVAKILKKVNGSKSQAAMILGVSRTTLWKKLKEADDE